MRVEWFLRHGFVVARGKVRPSFLSFFVDYDSSCWTSRIEHARRYKTKLEAESDLAELRMRAAIRRKESRGVAGRKG